MPRITRNSATVSRPEEGAVTTTAATADAAPVGTGAAPAPPPPRRRRAGTTTQTIVTHPAETQDRPRRKFSTIGWFGLFSILAAASWYWWGHITPYIPSLATTQNFAREYGMWIGGGVIALLFLISAIRGGFAEQGVTPRRGTAFLACLLGVIFAGAIFSLFGRNLLFWYQQNPAAIVATVIALIAADLIPKARRFAVGMLAIILLVAAAQLFWGWRTVCAVDPKTGLSPCALGDDGQLHFGDYEVGDVIGGSGESANVRILKQHATADDVNRITIIEGTKPGPSGYIHLPTVPGANLVRNLGESLTKPVIRGQEVTLQTPDSDLRTGPLKKGGQREFCFNPGLSVTWDSDPAIAAWEIGVKRWTSTTVDWIPWWKARPWTREGRDAHCLTFKYAKSPINTSPTAEIHIQVKRS